MESNQRVEGSTVQLLEDNKEAERRRKKRGLDSEKEPNNDAVETRIICLDSDPVPEYAQCNYDATDTEEVIDTVSVSLNCMENIVVPSNNEIRDGNVDLTMEESSNGDSAEGTQQVQADLICTITIENRMDDTDDVIDGVGGSSPALVPVFTSWPDSSEGETDNDDTDVQEAENVSVVSLSRGRLVRC